MNRNIMKGLSLLVILTIALIFSSCKSGEKAVLENSDQSDAIPLSSDNVPRSLNFSFPINNDLHVVSGDFTVMYGNIIGSLKLYRRVNGGFPESIQSYISSGFPMFWSRNVLDGTVVGYTSKEVLTLGRDDGSRFTYMQQDSDHATFSFIYPTSKIDPITGSEIWRDKKVDLVSGPYRDEEQRGYGDVADKIYSCPGSLKYLHEIPDEDLRWFVGKCEELVQYVNMRSSGYYMNNNSLPGKFSYLIKECNLFIKDNLLKFAEEMESRDVDFRIGYDYSKVTIYATLMIDGEMYINYCHRFAPPYSESEETPYRTGSFDGCRMSELDMSTPMISSDNFTEFILNLPPDVLIESKDIPIE